MNRLFYLLLYNIKHEKSQSNRYMEKEKLNVIVEMAGDGTFDCYIADEGTHIPEYDYEFMDYNHL